MAFEYKQDCIHLKACRRLQKIGRSKGHSFARGCSDDCSAYVSGDTELYCSCSSACRVAQSQYNGIHDPGDIYAPWDFDGRTLSEIINDLCEGERYG